MKVGVAALAKAMKMMTALTPTISLDSINYYERRKFPWKSMRPAAMRWA
jgi:hypothetical protein